MKIIFSILIMLHSFSIFCQSYGHIAESGSNPFLNDANGRPLYLVTNYRAEGSPYFINDYHNAEITTVSGTVYHNIKVKINLLDRRIQYMAADGKEMIAEIPVKKVLFTNLPAENGVGNVLLESFPLALNSKGAAVYEVLDTGKIKLLKKITVSARDEKKYNDAGITRVFERKEIYYALNARGQVKKVQKGRAALLELFDGNKDKVALFIDQNNINCKTETGYKVIFRFYNSISP